MKRSGVFRSTIAAATLIAVTLAARPATAMKPLAEQPTAVRGLLWTASALATPPYAALKTGLALCGAGTAAWMLTLSFDPDAALYLLQRGAYGDWWIRPEHLTRERPIEPLAVPSHPSSGDRPGAGKYPLE
jgi:hypothetical protein